MLTRLKLLIHAIKTRTKKTKLKQKLLMRQKPGYVSYRRGTRISFSNLYFDQINSEDYRKVLRNMADQGDGWISRADIIARSGLKEHTVTNALQALKSKNIILVSDSTKGNYKLPTKSFAAWIKALSHAPNQSELFGELTGG